MATSSLIFISLIFINMAVVFSRLPFVKNPLYFLLSIQLFGTNGIAILLLSAEFYVSDSIIDLAMAATLLAGVASLVFAKVFQAGSSK